MVCVGLIEILLCIYIIVIVIADVLFIAFIMFDLGVALAALVILIVIIAGRELAVIGLAQWNWQLSSDFVANGNSSSSSGSGTPLTASCAELTQRGCDVLVVVHHLTCVCVCLCMLVC